MRFRRPGEGFRRPRRGQALIAAILVLTVLTAAAIALSATARLEVRAARRGVDEVQREAALRGAVNRGIALLDDGRTDPEALLSTLRKYRKLRWTPFIPDSDPDQPQLEMAVQLLDPSARLNINTADSSQLQKLPGMDEDAASSIVSWRNEKSRDRYDRGPRPYEPKRRPFDTVEELLLVHDVERQRFFGSPSTKDVTGRATPPLSEWLTAWSGENNADAEGNPRADVNSAASSELLDAANRIRQCVTPEQMQTLMQKRDQRQAGGAGGQSGRNQQQQPQQFQSVSEALREAGTEEAKWGPVLDAWTVDRRTFLPGRVNVNTASPAVLATLSGMTPEQAEQVVRKRESKPGGLDWTDLLDLLAPGQQDSSGGGEQPPGSQPGNRLQEQQQQQQPNQNQGQGVNQLERLFCLRSSVYLVRCLVREKGSHRTDAVAALVHWPVSPDDPAQIVQWRQPDRFPGWSAWYRPLAEDERIRGGRQKQ